MFRPSCGHLQVVFQNLQGYEYLYRCTVHSVVYLINTPTNAHIFIWWSKIHVKTLKTLLHVSIIRSSSRNTRCSLLQLQFKNTQWFTSLRWVGAVAACRVYCVNRILFRMSLERDVRCASYSVRVSHESLTLYTRHVATAPTQRNDVNHWVF